MEDTNQTSQETPAVVAEPAGPAIVPSADSTDSPQAEQSPSEQPAIPPEQVMPVQPELPAPVEPQAPAVAEPVPSPAPPVQAEPQSQISEPVTSAAEPIPSAQPILPVQPQPVAPAVSEAPGQISPQPPSPASTSVVPSVSVFGKIAAIIRERIANRREKRLQKILDFLAQNGKITNAEARKILKVSAATATRYFEILEKRGWIRQAGAKGYTYYLPAA